MAPLMVTPMSSSNQASTGGSDLQTGTLAFNTFDQFNFQGADVLIDQALSIGGGYGATGASISATGNIQANGNLTIDGTIIPIP